MNKTIDLNIRGQICPSCLLIALKEMNEHGDDIREGSTEVVVTTDDRQATSTIPATADRMGFRTEVTRLDEGTLYRIRIYGAN